MPVSHTWSDQQLFKSVIQKCYPKVPKPHHRFASSEKRISTHSLKLLSDTHLLYSLQVQADGIFNYTHITSSNICIYMVLIVMYKVDHTCYNCIYHMHIYSQLQLTKYSWRQQIMHQLICVTPLQIELLHQTHECLLAANYIANSCTSLRGGRSKHTVNPSNCCPLCTDWFVGTCWLLSYIATAGTLLQGVTLSAHC